MSHSHRLLIVDARLRQRRGLYERLLSQTLTPSAWFGNTARDPSSVFTFEGGYAVDAVGTNAVNLLEGFQQAAA